MLFRRCGRSDRRMDTNTKFQQNELGYFVVEVEKLLIKMCYSDDRIISIAKLCEGKGRCVDVAL